MVRGVLFFLVMWFVLAVALTAFRALTKQEKWKVAKVALVAGSLAVAAFALVLTVVFLF